MADPITAIIAELPEGGVEARNRLVTAIYRELKRVAAAQLRVERPNHTLQPTALAHEACMRLLRGPCEWKDREHLFRTAAAIMRHILTDYARSKAAEKRGAFQVTIALGDHDEPAAPWSSLTVEDVLALDHAIEKLKELDERQAAIVEMRFFAGLTEEEIAEALGISVRTVRRDWESARAWLHGQLRTSRSGS